jgi:cellulose synthase operon protein C
VIRRRRFALGLAPLVAAGCASSPDSGTLAALRTVEPDVAEVEVADTLDLAMQSYRRYLAETPTSVMTPEAMRRLADLQLEKEFGLTGGPPTRRWTEMPAPEYAGAPAQAGAALGTADAARRAPTTADAMA